MRRELLPSPGTAGIADNETCDETSAVGHAGPCKHQNRMRSTNAAAMHSVAGWPVNARDGAGTQSQQRAEDNADGDTFGLT